MMTITKIWNYSLSVNEEVFQVVERGRNFESRRNVYREKGRDRVTLFFCGWLTSSKNWVWFSGVKNSFGICVCFCGVWTLRLDRRADACNNAYIRN
jgi:hypothetical protein